MIVQRIGTSEGMKDVPGELAEGDGAAISNERSINIVAKDAAEVLLFDVA